MQPLTKIVVIFAVVLLALAVALLVVGRMGLLRGSAPNDLGVHDGRLKPPSKTANSVSSQAALHPGHPQAETARIEPFHYSGDGAVAMERLARAVKAFPYTRIVSRNAEYLRAESTTPMLQFTDDLEFWLDPSNRVIQLRSASRIGRRDFDANRKRIEALRAVFAGG